MTWSIRTERFEASTDFEVQQLRDGLFLNYRDKYLTEEEFIQDEHCS